MAYQALNKSIGTAIVIVDKAKNSTTTSTRYETDIVVDGKTTTLPTAGLMVDGTLTIGTALTKTNSLRVTPSGTLSYV